MTKTVGTNFLTLPWPQDPQGALKGLKTGGVSAVGRVKGNKERHDALMKSLRILAQYATEKFEQETALREKTKADAISAFARVEQRKRRVAENQIAVLDAQRERLLTLAGRTIDGAAD